MRSLCSGTLHTYSSSSPKLVPTFFFLKIQKRLTSQKNHENLGQHDLSFFLRIGRLKWPTSLSRSERRIFKFIRSPVRSSNSISFFYLVLSLIFNSIMNFWWFYQWSIYRGTIARKNAPTRLLPILRSTINFPILKFAFLFSNPSWQHLSQLRRQFHIP